MHGQGKEVSLEVGVGGAACCLVVKMRLEFHDSSYDYSEMKEYFPSVVIVLNLRKVTGKC